MVCGDLLIAATLMIFDGQRHVAVSRELLLMATREERGIDAILRRKHKKHVGSFCAEREFDEAC